MKTLLILISSLIVSVTAIAQTSDSAEPTKTVVHHTIDFGVKRTYYSWTFGFAYTNNTKNVLGIKNIRTTGKDYSDRNTCPQYLSPGAQCAIYVIFNPLSPGTSKGKMTIDTDDTLHIIELTGIGID